MFRNALPAWTSETFIEHCKSAVPAELWPHLEGLFKIIGQLTQQISNYDKRVESLGEQYPAVARLREISGVGPLTALTFVATIGDRFRFGSSRDVGAYLGLRPRQRQSGSQNPQLGISKTGDSYLRRLLVQSAHCVLSRYGPDTALKQWGLKLCERGGSNAKRRAVVAVARKLSVLLHKLWVSGGHYRPFPVH